MCNLRQVLGAHERGGLPELLPRDQRRVAYFIYLTATPLQTPATRLRP